MSDKTSVQPEPKTLKQRWRDIRPHILAPIIYAIISTLLKTLKINTKNYEAVKAIPTGKIMCSWHGRPVLGAHFFRGQGIYAIISHSRDGEMQNTIFTKFGFKTIRGSTGRGGMKALLESIKILKKGETLAFTPDGPRGPSGIVQPGIMLMAKKSGVPLIPVGVSAQKRWLFNSWDRYFIPKPFSKAIMIFGEPINVPPDATEEQIEEIRLHLQEQIHKCEAQAEAEFNYPPPTWHKQDPTSP